jgi:hypothetical protein
MLRCRGNDTARADYGDRQADKRVAACSDKLGRLAHQQAIGADAGESGRGRARRVKNGFEVKWVVFVPPNVIRQCHTSRPCTGTGNVHRVQGGSCGVGGCRLVRKGHNHKLVA